MQDLYDGVYIGMPAGKPEVSNSDYLAIEALYGKKEGEAKRGIFESIVNKYMGYFLNGTNKAVRKIGVEKILNDSYVNPPILLFNPSYHAITDDENNPSSWAVDLRKSKESDLLEKKHNDKRELYLELYKKDIGRAYDGSDDGEPHIHVTYKP